MPDNIQSEKDKRQWRAKHAKEFSDSQFGTVEEYTRHVIVHQKQILREQQQREPRTISEAVNSVVTIMTSSPDSEGMRNEAARARQARVAELEKEEERKNKKKKKQSKEQ